MANQDYVEKYRKEYSNSGDKPIKTNDNKFGINVKQYPSNLQSDELKHYVLFNINVRGKSKTDPGKRLFEVKRDPNSANLTEDALAAAATNGMAVSAGLAVGASVTSLVKNAKRSVNSTGSQQSGTKAQQFAKKSAPYAIGAGAGLAAGAATSAAMSFNDMLKPDTTYRISDAIALYVDGPPTVKYSMNYANKELGTLLGVLSGGIAASLGALNPLGEKGAALGATLAKLPGAFGGGDLGAAVGKSAGTALNPFKEVVFESVDFRSFSFKYKFFPKSAQEAEDVRTIITLFKEHMHPELSESKLFFIYPSEFQITYYFENEENSYVHKFRPCALESLDVSYGGDQYSTFTDGNPTEVTLSLTFRELEILTRQMIRDGH